MLAKNQVKKRSKTSKKRTTKRRGVSLRIPPEVLRELDSMAAEVGMSRNALIVLMLTQSAAMHQAESDNPGLFSATEQLIDGALRRAWGKRGDK